MAGQKFDAEPTGDESLSGRPMARVASPLREMGAVIETQEGGRPAQDQRWASIKRD